jgi:hypothetical protein
MKGMKGRDEEENDRKEDLEGFEIELEERFAPVKPNPEFVDRLRRRLAYGQGTELEIPNQMVNLGIVTSILVIGLLLTVGLARLIYDFLRLIGVTHSGRE